MLPLTLPPHAARRAACLRRTLALAGSAALLVACGGDPEPGGASSGPVTTRTEDSTSTLTMQLRGEFQPEVGAVLKVEQSYRIEDARFLGRIGEAETTGRMSLEATENHLVQYLEGGVREITIGPGGTVTTTRMDGADEVREERESPLEGAVVTAVPDAGGDGFQYRLRSGTQAELPAGFEPADLRADALYTEQWREVGEVWQAPPEAVGQLLGPGFQLDEGDVRLRVKGHTQRGGQPCAEVVADIRVSGAFRSDGAEQEVSLRMEGKLYRSLHHFEDLEAELEGSIEIRESKGDGEVRIEGPITFRRLASYLSDDAEID